MILEIRAALPFMTNGFVLGCEATRAGVVIDPGDNVEALVAAVRAHGLTVSHILLTHAHLDHITGVGAAKAALGAPVGLHADDRALYDAIVQQGQMFGLRLERQPPPDFALAAGDSIRFGAYEIRVHHTPGHSPGGVCLQVGRAGEAGRTLIVGDTLFAGSIGRTDLPGGHLATLLTSIRTVLFPFGDDAIVYPGHGEATTIGEERRNNPFLA
jgi:glyoxylase-like metal-dependent hydrolase (beta-lactamase superfamily II)